MTPKLVLLVHSVIIMATTMSCVTLDYFFKQETLVTYQIITIDLCDLLYGYK